MILKMLPSYLGSIFNQNKKYFIVLTQTFYFQKPTHLLSQLKAAQSTLQPKLLIEKAIPRTRQCDITSYEPQTVSP
jgi:hypothetical protein